MNAKVGMLAGDIWEALSQKGEMELKELKKVAKIKTDRDLYMALGWLLREDKLVMTDVDKSFLVVLK